MKIEGRPQELLEFIKGIKDVTEIELVIEDDSGIFPREPKDPDKTKAGIVGTI